MKHPAEKSLGWILVQTARAHRSRVGARLSEIGLYAGQEQALQALASSGPLTMGDLASFLHVRPPTASKTVSRLTDLGLIERMEEHRDGRVVRVKLTGKGLSKAQEIDRICAELEIELLAGFDLKDRKKLRKLLQRVVCNLGQSRASESDIDLDMGEAA